MARRVHVRAGMAAEGQHRDLAVVGDFLVKTHHLLLRRDGVSGIDRGGEQFFADIVYLHNIHRIFLNMIDSSKSLRYYIIAISKKRMAHFGCCLITERTRR